MMFSLLTEDVIEHERAEKIPNSEIPASILHGATPLVDTVNRFGVRNG